MMRRWVSGLAAGACIAAAAGAAETPAAPAAPQNAPAAPQNAPAAPQDTPAPTAAAATASRTAMLPFLSRTLTLPRQAAAYGRAQHAALPLQPGEVVLTFDDGPRPASTPSVLATLKRFGVQATFFMNGEPMRSHPELARQVLAEGHSVGMHGFAHPHFATLSPAAQLADLQAMQRTYREVLGSEPAAYRFPFLEETPTLMQALQAQGLTVMSVDIGIDDWVPSETPAILAERLKSRLTSAGGIVLMHDAQDLTAAALPLLLQTLKDAGFRVVALRWQ